MQIKFGSLVTAGAGKLGGHQVQRGRWAPSLVTKRSGNRRTQRKNTRQNLLLREIATLWRSMSAENQNDWLNPPFGGFPTKQKFGEEVPMAGWPAFVWLNTALWHGGWSWASDLNFTQFDYSPDFLHASYQIEILGNNIRVFTTGDSHTGAPVVYLAGFNKGQKCPPLSKHVALPRPYSETSPGNPRYKREEIPGIEGILQCDFLSTFLRGFEAGVPEDFVRHQVTPMASQI